MKKVPYGISSYKALKEEGYLYVDKTMYLEKLENVAKTLFYLRPGRFGKTLFTSMMYYYYDVNSEYLFDTLFGDTFIYDKPTSNKNNYYMLKFDFSGISTKLRTKEELEERFKECVIFGINNFIEYYGINYEIDDNRSIEGILKLFFSALLPYTKEHKVYILVDEYDNFTNGILEGDTTLFRSVVNENGFVKAFYAVIKEGLGLGIVDRFFATGICPVTLNSMTTGFNIARDITTDFRFNSMIGLTHEEVSELLDGYEKEVRDEIYDMMMKNYDGYLFSDELGEDDRVFNATLVMYFLDNYNETHKYPKSLVDNNITVNYEKIDNLIHLQNNNFHKELIQEILDDNSVIGRLKTKFTLIENFSKDDVISLLYYFGYLTIDRETSGGTLAFRIPNYVMKETYNNYFLKILGEYDIKIEASQSMMFADEIKMGKIDAITKFIEEVLIKLDNRLFINFREADIEMLYSAFLNGAKEFNLYTEYPCNGRYGDIFIEGNREYMDYNILIELKYIKKKEYSNKLLETKKEEGRGQLEEYSKDVRLHNKELKKYLVVFVGNKVKIIEEC